MSAYRYAFKILSGPSEGKVMELTDREFNMIFDGLPPDAGRKALAYSEFSYLPGVRAIRVTATT